jgi:hypothetical protein
MYLKKFLFLILIVGLVSAENEKEITDKKPSPVVSDTNSTVTTSTIKATPSVSTENLIKKPIADKDEKKKDPVESVESVPTVDPVASIGPELSTGSSEEDELKHGSSLLGGHTSSGHSGLTSHSSLTSHSVHTNKKPVTTTHHCPVCPTYTCPSCPSERHCPSCPKVCHKDICDEPHEVYKSHADLCDELCYPNFCHDVGLTGTYREGCFCKQGYSRNSFGKCVPESQCPKCGLHEVLATRPDCSDKCDPSNCLKSNVNRCFCVQGYKKDSLGNCIEEHHCSGKNCGPYEVYLTNQNACSERCDSKVCHPTYRDGCYCVQGYKRNQQYQCVLQNQCPTTSTCESNEVYLQNHDTCADQCDKTNCQTSYRDGCYCKEGYKKNEYKNCVPESQCPKKCGPNENYLTKQDSCSDLCDKSGCYTTYIDGCYCVPGYKRDRYSNCVLEKLCYNCTDHEVYTECSGPCYDACDTTNCGSKECKKGCGCVPGFKRNLDGYCIPEGSCPTCTGENEKYTYGDACTNRCDKTLPCVSEGSKPGCYCKPDYLQNYQGVCVHKSTCLTCKKSNEKYTAYGKSCLDSCVDDLTACASEPYKPMCYCEKNYQRDPQTGGCSKCPHNEKGYRYSFDY